MTGVRWLVAVLAGVLSVAVLVQILGSGDDADGQVIALDAATGWLRVTYTVEVL
jgi:hypothetical protein